MQLISRIGAGLVGAMALTVLISWYANIAALRVLWPGLLSMKPVTALTLIFLSVAVIAIGQRALALPLSVVTAAIGALVLARYILDSPLGIYPLFPGINFGGDIPQMAPATALSLLLLGASVVASLLGRTTLMLTLVVAVLCGSQIAVQGYAYGVSSLYELGNDTSMSLPTALGVTVLSLSILLQHPSAGLVRLLWDRESTGKFLRPGMLFIIFGPFTLGWLILWAQRQGWFDAAFSVTLLVLSMTLLGFGLIFMTAVGLRKLDRQRHVALHALDQANRKLKTTVEARTHELAETAQKLHTFLQIAPVGIVQLDTKGGFVATNEQWRALSGLTMQESLGDGWATAIHPEDADRVLAEWKSAVSTGKAYETTMRFLTPAGHMNWVQVSTTPIIDTEHVGGYLASVTDITALSAAQESASAARARFEAAFASSPLGTAIVSLDGRVLEANRRLFELTGRSTTAVLNEPIEAIFMQPETVNSASTRQQIDRQIRREDKEETWVKVSVATIHEGAQTSGLLYQLEDVTARRVAEARLQHLAFHDPLTNLPNRMLLLDRLKQALLQAVRHDLGVGVLFIDLDRFKTVNDDLGHHAGDVVLSKVAVRLRLSARTSDTVARIGGDEFVVICPDVKSLRDVYKIAETLQKAIVKPILIGDQTASVGASIGVVFGVGHDDPEELLRDADQAMYLVKNKQSNSG